ncbi:MAG: sporulation sigma factor SigE, partial [Acutalibacteraceae bacterium]|nr:sporulation sigma factor SigE [Acutalibacteraceae bacterium]
MLKLLNKIRELVLKLKTSEYDTVFYVNGPETLPPPLSKEEEQELMDRLGDGDEAVREKLIVHNLRLVVYIAKKFESSG